MAKKRCRAMLPPAAGSKRIRINEHIEIGWEKTSLGKQVRTFVDDKPFLSCSFLLVSLPANDPANEDVTIEDLAERPGARDLEGTDAVGFKDEQGNALSEDDILWGHASALQAWVEHDYNTICLHANLSFPLLRELARVGDAKAKRVLGGEIRDRLANGHLGTAVNILDTCADIMDAEDWGILMRKWGRNDEIIGAVLGNPRVPIEMLRRIVASPRVRASVGLIRAFIANGACTEQDILAFKDNASPVIRREMMDQLFLRSLKIPGQRYPYSHGASEAIRHALLHDPSDTVRVSAMRACTDPEVLHEALGHFWLNTPLLIELAANRYLREETMLELVKWRGGQRYRRGVWASLAGNPSATGKVLDLLAKTGEPEVLEVMHGSRLIQRSLPDAQRIMYFKRMSVEVSDVNRLSIGHFALTVEGRGFHSFFRRELIEEFMKRVGIRADIEPRGIGRLRRQYRVEGTFKQVEVSWPSAQLGRYAREHGYLPMRLCVPLLADRKYVFRGGKVEENRTCARVEAIYRRGTIIHKTPALALYEGQEVPESDRLWEPELELADDPPISIQRIYTWQKTR